MTFMSIRLLILAARIAIAQRSVMVPIAGISHFGRPSQFPLAYVDVIVPELSNSSIRAFISPAARCMSLVPEYSETDYNYLHNVFIRTNVSDEFFRSQCELRGITFQDTPSYVVGIGPRSWLLHYSNSVDYIWRNGSEQPMALVLNLTLDLFNTTTCNNMVVATVPIPVSGVYGISVSTIVDGRPMTQAARYVFSQTADRIQIPSRIYQAILFIVHNEGNQVDFLHWGPPPQKFRNCERIKHLLPIIRFKLGTGIISLNPVDYVANVGDDECKLLVTTPRDSSPASTFEINPLILRGVNFRFTNDYVAFCDTAIEQDHLTIE